MAAYQQVLFISDSIRVDLQRVSYCLQAVGGQLERKPAAVPASSGFNPQRGENGLISDTIPIFGCHHPTLIIALFQPRYMWSGTTSATTTTTTTITAASSYGSLRSFSLPTAATPFPFPNAAITFIAVKIFAAAYAIVIVVIVTPVDFVADIIVDINDWRGGGNAATDE
jgi:hypothetical protein